MRGNEIIVSSEPLGKFQEGRVLAALLPGTVVELAPGSTPDEYQWQAATRASGAVGMVAVLLPDQLQGKLATDAYVSGTRCFVYVPAPGDELNMLLAGVGTHTVGEQLMVQTGTGMLITNAAGASVPFTCLEAYTVALTAPALTHCKYNGQ
jgi:hypothetical protein